MNPTSQIHDLVRRERITPSDGAMLIELRRQIRDARWYRRVNIATFALSVAILVVWSIVWLGWLA